MTVSMYKVSVPVFVQHLTALSGVLDKATTHIESKKLEPAFFIGMRLYPDMYPLTRQVQQATAHPIRACSMLAGREPLDLPGIDASFAELKARIAKTVDYVKGFKPAEIDGTEDKEITIKFTSGERKFTGQGQARLHGPAAEFVRTWAAAIKRVRPSSTGLWPPLRGVAAKRNLRHGLRDPARRRGWSPRQLQQAVDLAPGVLREVLTRELAVPFSDRRVTRGAYRYCLSKTRRPIVTQRRILGAPAFATLKERHQPSPFVPPGCKLLDHKIGLIG
jgi:hypothetical protein